MGVWKSFARFFRKDTEDLERHFDAFENLIGYRFRDRALLRKCLTHRSFVRAGNHRLPSNERLEFLGDSVLGLVVAHQLFVDYPRRREGELTKTKAMLVNENTLAAVGKDVGLNDFILLSPEEERTGGRDRSSIISDAFEAVIGAVYLDSGFEAARAVVLKLLYSRREEILSDTSLRNFKGDLLELAQARGEGMPRYEVVGETGPDHEKEFRVVVTVNGEKIGEGHGLSKKEAEQRAASQALEQLEQYDEQPD